MKNIYIILLLIIGLLFSEYILAKDSYLGESCSSKNSELPIRFIDRKRNTLGDETDLEYMKSILKFVESFRSIKFKVYHSSEELKNDTGETIFDNYNNLVNFKKENLLMVYTSSYHSSICKLNVFDSHNTLTLNFYYIMPSDIKFPHAIQRFGILKYILPKNKKVNVEINYRVKR